MPSYVSPKIVIKRQSDKGIGSFANEKIAKGEIILIQAGQIIANHRLLDPNFQPFSSHCFQIEKDFHICPFKLDEKSLDGIFHVNHSCNPNCGFLGQIVLVSMRVIEKGEEITYDYAMTDANFDGIVCPEMQCLCGEADCRGVITGEDWKNVELQKKYNGYFSSYIQKILDEQ